MAAPTIVSGSTVNGSTTYPKPTGMQNGDYVAIRHSWYTDNNSSVPNLPTGFSAAFTFSTLLYGSSRLGIAILYKPITDAANEPANYTVTGVNALYWEGGRIDLLRHPNGLAFDDGGSNTGTSSPQSTGANITTTGAEAILLIGCTSNGGSAATPSGMTQSYEMNDVEGWYEALTSLLSGATRSSALSPSTQWMTGFVAFKPAAGGGGGGAPIPVFMNHYRQMGIA